METIDIGFGINLKKIKRKGIDKRILLKDYKIINLLNSKNNKRR